MAAAGVQTNGANVNGPANNSTANALIYPALHLFPLNDTFIPKQILLAPPGERIKIGRQTNAKTVPNPQNGYFDSKVLSRMHAEVWCEEGKVFIKDVKSSNGTFINGERLSPEGVESDVFELHSDDVVEFGIDIVSDDNKTIVHHKVSAKVHLVFTAEDALMMNNKLPAYYRSIHDAQLQRRASKPGATSFSFDHVLTRLQTELQKSRETGAELNSINGVMTDIHDTLGGGGPPLPAYVHNGRIPPIMPPPGPKDPHASTIAQFQAQLSETQHSLAQHVDKVRGLETLLAEHDSMKHEVNSLRAQMDEAKREMDSLLRASRAATTGTVRQRPLVHEDDDEDFDTRSIASVDTIRPSSPLPPTQQSENRPVSPPPLSNNTAAIQVNGHKSSDDAHPLEARVELLAAELAEATALGESLRSQHAAATEAARALQARVESLEARVQEAERGADGRWDGWKKAFEASWAKDREEWVVEREKLRLAVADWEERRREEDLSSSSDDELPQTSSTSPTLTTGAYPHSPDQPTAALSRTRKSGKRRRRRSTAGPTSIAAALGAAGAVVSASAPSTSRIDEERSSEGGSSVGTAVDSPEVTMRYDQLRSRTNKPLPHRKPDSSAAIPVATAVGIAVMGVAVYSVLKQNGGSSLSSWASGG